jgi:hypothetical protein
MCPFSQPCYKRSDCIRKEQWIQLPQDIAQYSVSAAFKFPSLLQDFICCLSIYPIWQNYILAVYFRGYLGS